MGRGGATSQSKALFEDYEGFVEKFKQKKTTDDCMTPHEVYEVVAEWVAERYGVAREDMVRPFWPGGDYESFEYPDGCCVVDNPPFSILAKIKAFYLGRGVRFFLFCPTLTAFSGKGLTERLTTVCCDAQITYENGAVVPTSFVTDMGGDVVAESEPELSERINAAGRALKARETKQLPKYEYPDSVVTAAKMQWLARHGERFQVRRGECCRISSLDAQRGKAIYGGGLLLSERAAAERAAAERAAAERAAAERFELSDRERAMQRRLGRSS